jgi:hypothetical protein
MNILLQSKPAVESHFKKSAVFCGNLLDMVGQGEACWGFLTGAADDGWEITVGFFNEKARYVAYKKRSGERWGEGDLRTVLMQIGPFANWSVKAGANFFDYVEKRGDSILAQATGWQTPERNYAFVYIPTVEGDIDLLPVKGAVDKKFSDSGHAPKEKPSEKSSEK